jgi:hypothetical protein
MKLPASLRVGPYSYAVEVKPDLRDPKDNRELYGRYETSPSPTIQLRAGEPEARQWAILLHEAIHTIDEYMVIGLSEKQTTRLGTGLAAFLLDNGLVKEDDGAEGV